MATRQAIGARAGQLASQLLSESLILALLGGVLGILAAPFVYDALVVTDREEIERLLARAERALEARDAAAVLECLAPQFRSTADRLSGETLAEFEATPSPDETSHEDNRDTRFLRVNDQKIRVLYLENLPRDR